jgi:molybdopterin converting factor small subunit
MRIHFLLFALYRDLTGVSELEIDVQEGSSAAAALAALRENDARFLRIPDRPVVAINRVYAGLDVLLREGDELALLPPVAGG